MSRACTRALLPSLQWGNRGTSSPQELCAFGCEDAVLVPTPARCPSSSWPLLKVLCSPWPPPGAQGDPREMLVVKRLQEQSENSPPSCYVAPRAATSGCTIPASPAQPSRNPPSLFLNSSFFNLILFFTIAMAGYPCAEAEQEQGN